MSTTSFVKISGTADKAQGEEGERQFWQDYNTSAPKKRPVEDEWGPALMLSLESQPWYISPQEHGLEHNDAA